MQAAHGADTLPDPTKYEGKNVAFGLYSHFHTTFETDALVKSLGARGGRRVPFIVCKLRTDVARNTRSRLSATPAFHGSSATSRAAAHPRSTTELRAAPI